MLVVKGVDVAYRTVSKIEGLPMQGTVTMKPLMGGDEMIMLEIHYPAGTGSPVHVHQAEDSGFQEFVLDGAHRPWGGMPLRVPICPFR